MVRQNLVLFCAVIAVSLAVREPTRVHAAPPAATAAPAPVPVVRVVAAKPKADAHGEVKAEVKAELPSTPAPASKSDRRAEPKAEPKPDPHAEPKPDPIPASASAPPASAAAAAPPAHDTSGITPDEARTQLSEGNFRYLDGMTDAPRRDEARRTDTATNGQHPIAAVLSCADSRVPVELIFDQGIGDIFSVRVAGNIAEPYGLGSIEYGVEHLGIPLIVVMGHTKCGAVKAALDGGEVEGNLGELLKEIAPAAEEVKARAATATVSASPSALANAAVRANVRLTMRNMVDRSPVLAAAIQSGNVKLVGAVYDISAGGLQWIESGTSVSSAAPAPESPAEPDAATKSHSKPKASAHSSAADAHDTATPPAAESPKKKKTSAQTADAHEPADTKKSSSKKTAVADTHGKDAHAKDAHGEEADPHADAEGHDADPDKSDAHAAKTATAAKKDNWMILGAMGVGAMGMSFGVIQFMGSKKKAKAAAH